MGEGRYPLGMPWNFNVNGPESMQAWVRKLRRRAWVYKVTLAVMVLPIVAVALIVGVSVLVTAIVALVIFSVLSMIARMVEAVQDLFTGGPPQDEVRVNPTADDGRERENVRVLRQD